MIKNNRNESIFNIIFAIIFGSLMIYGYGIIGEFIYIFQLLPFLILLLNDGIKAWALSLVISLAVQVLFFDYLTISYLALAIGLVSLYVGWAVKRNKNIYEILLNATLIKVILFGAYLYAIRELGQVDIVAIARESVDYFISSVHDQLASSIDITQDQVSAFMVQLNKIINDMLVIIPAITFVFTYICVSIAVIASLYIWRRSGSNHRYMTKLNIFGGQVDLKIFIALSLITSLVLTLFNFRYTDFVLQNLAFVIASFLFINGLFVLDFYLERRGKMLIRFILPVLLIFFLGYYTVYIILGAMDLIFNLRRRILINENRINK